MHFYMVFLYTCGSWVLKIDHYRITCRSAFVMHSVRQNLFVRSCSEEADKLKESMWLQTLPFGQGKSTCCCRAGWDRIPLKEFRFHPVRQQHVDLPWPKEESVTTWALSTCRLRLNMAGPAGNRKYCSGPHVLMSGGSTTFSRGCCRGGQSCQISPI